MSVSERVASQLSPDERGDLASFLGGLPARLDRLAACGLPDTLVHGDFHSGNFRGRVVHLLLLLYHLFVHGGNSAIKNVFFLLHPLVLINRYNLVRDIGRFLRICIEDADLKKVGVSNLIDL